MELHNLDSSTLNEHFLQSFTFGCLRINPATEKRCAVVATAKLYLCGVGQGVHLPFQRNLITQARSCIQETDKI